jgi:hypothetical protein
MSSVFSLSCENCGRTWLANGLGAEKLLEHFGWRRMPAQRGHRMSPRKRWGPEHDYEPPSQDRECWRCPHCTGITGLLEKVHARVVNGKAVVEDPVCPRCPHPVDHHNAAGFCSDGPCPCYLYLA